MEGRVLALCGRRGIDEGRRRDKRGQAEGAAEGALGLVVCPDALEAGFVEDDVGFAEGEVVADAWGGRFLGEV